MIRVTLTWFALAISLNCLSQAPQGMNYQAVIRDNIGFPITNQQVGMRMSIMENSATLYAETHTPTTNDMGLVNMVIGQGTVEQGVFEDIDWANGTFMVQTEADVTGGTNYVIMGAQQLMSVPYALYAEAAGQPASVSTIGDTLFLGDGTSIVIPGISGVNGGLGNGVYIPGGGVIDVDGNSYPTVILGDQEWMAENLRTSKFANGDDIPSDAEFMSDWNNLINGPQCAWYNFDSSLVTIADGRLYNTAAVLDGRDVCPSGWHVPSIYEWNTLIIYLGGSAVAGGKMKLDNSAFWYDAGGYYVNLSASNISGLNVIGSRCLDDCGYRTEARFWSSNLGGGGNKGIRIEINTDDAVISNEAINAGCSIRCIKDQ